MFDWIALTLLCSAALSCALSSAYCFGRAAGLRESRRMVEEIFKADY